MVQPIVILMIANDVFYDSIGNGAVFALVLLSTLTLLALLGFVRNTHLVESSTALARKLLIALDLGLAALLTGSHVGTLGDCISCLVHLHGELSWVFGDVSGK